MRLIGVLCAFALSACGAGSEPAEPAGSDTSTSAQPAPAEPATPLPPVPPSTAVSAKPDEVDCAGMPAFMALTADAVVDGCFVSLAGPGFGNGTVIFATGLAPDAVVAFYRSKARAAGMADGPADSAAGSYSANLGSKRTIKVTTRPRAAGGLRVTLNWTQDE